MSSDDDEAPQLVPVDQAECHSRPRMLKRSISPVGELRAARAGDKRAEEWVLGLLESFAYEGAAQQERAAERSQQQR